MLHWTGLDVVIIECPTAAFLPLPLPLSFSFSSSSSLTHSTLLLSFSLTSHSLVAVNYTRLTEIRRGRAIHLLRSCTTQASDTVSRTCCFYSSTTILAASAVLLLPLPPRLPELSVRFAPSSIALTGTLRDCLYWGRSAYNPGLPLRHSLLLHASPRPQHQFPWLPISESPLLTGLLSCFAYSAPRLSTFPVRHLRFGTRPKQTS